MRLARTFVSRNAFEAQWPQSAEALARLCEGPLVPPDNRYALSCDAIRATKERPDVSGIARALGRLWAFDERFFGEVICGGQSDFRWAVYCAAYLIEDPQIAADLLDVFCPLLGEFGVETFGENFVLKTCSTFQDEVAEVIWELQDLEGPVDETEFFDWHGQLNGFPDTLRADLLARAGLPLLEYESFPPLDVMLVFCRGASSLVWPAMPEANYLADLSEFYEDRGYRDVAGAVFATEECRDDMIHGALFCNLTSDAIAAAIREAEHSVCYAAPGVQIEPAKAMAELAVRIGPELITVCLDFDERVMRMGYGDLPSVKVLRDARIAVRSTPGLRTGLIIVDHQGYIFTPTALYLEAEDRPAGAPNAMRLSRRQVAEALARLSPAAKAIAIAMASTEDEREHIRETAVEVPSQPIAAPVIERVERRLAVAPPVRFDVARQVRVFNAYLQYVELSLTGAAIQRHRIAIPASIQKLGGAKDLEGRLRTTFDLIEKDGEISSRALEVRLKEIRKNFTPSLGKDHGRVVLKAAKLHLEKRLAEFRSELETHQQTVRKELQGRLDESRQQIVEYYLPIVVKNPPDSMLGKFVEHGANSARTWLTDELEGVFPKAETLIQNMQLEVRYKDVTFETLNQANFLTAVEKAFPNVDWDSTYSEFKAVGENAKKDEPKG